MTGPLANARHEAFARGIVAGKSGREAYRAAGYTARTDGAADACASRLLADAKVSARVEALKREAAQGAVMTANEVLVALSNIGRADAADFVRAFASGDPVAAVDQLAPAQTAALAEVTVEQFMDGGGEDARPVRRIKYRLHSKTSALELLGKYHKLFVERLAHEDPDGKPAGTGALNELEVARRIAFALAAGARAQPQASAGPAAAETKAKPKRRAKRAARKPAKRGRK